MELVFIFVLGLLFGSFANVLVFRLNTGEPIVSSRSKCFACAAELKWFENIPIVSFFVLKGRCRTCGAKISWQYPAIEFASGFLFLVLYWQIQPNLEFRILNFETLRFTATALFFWILLVISVYDIRHNIIPNGLVYATAFLAFLFQILNSGFQIQVLLPPALSALGLFSFFASLWFVSKGRWMGFGDAKMALAIGLFLGWPETLAAFLFSFWLGAAYGVILILVKGYRRISDYKGIRGMQIPLAPFLFVGAFAAFLWGESIISWYLGLI